MARPGHESVPGARRAPWYVARALDTNRTTTGVPQQSRARLYIAITAIVLVAIFILQNTQKVEVKFFFSSTETPLIFALLLAAALGFVIGLGLPRFRTGGRHRKDD